VEFRVLLYEVWIFSEECENGKQMRVFVVLTSGNAVVHNRGTTFR
jgi:hypothetical protein